MIKAMEKFIIWLGNVSHPSNYRRAGAYIQMFTGMIWEILRRRRLIAICYFLIEIVKRYNLDRMYWRKHGNIVRQRILLKKRIAYPVLKEVIHDFGKLLHPKSLWCDRRGEEACIIH
jgi:hypothetical protein